jgi:hypothetical protein
MRSTSKRRPCTDCGVVTSFERQLSGKRRRNGEPRYEPACVPHCEQPKKATA